MNDRFGDKHAYFQLHKALQAKSEKKVAKWQEILSGILLSELRIGDRNPVRDMPLWATPEVVRGGFATGAYAAGGEIREHERVLAQELSITESDAGRLRAALNAWHISGPGLERLKDYARSGLFDAETPEEMALLTVAVLSESDKAAVNAILDAITPFFDRLRFYPVPSNVPRGDGVHVRTIGQLRDGLENKRPSKDIVLQHVSLTVWLPLYDRLVDLAAEAMDKEWQVRADTWFDDYDHARKKPTSRRWSRSDGPFQRCLQLLDKRRKRKTLSEAEESYIKLIAARRSNKYGEGWERDAYRIHQLKQDVSVRYDALSKTILNRLDGLADHEGAEDIQPLLSPIEPEEARSGAETGVELPKPFVRKIMSVQIAPVADLVESGQVSSPEVLAVVLPQITSNLLASGFKTLSERQVYACLYRAFRLRRSLLLLDLQSQVRLDELPWAAALQNRQVNSRSSRQIAHDAFAEVASLSLVHFPHVQFPNSLIEEMQQLTKTAKLNAPLTRELAADIFMGEFSRTFEHAAAIAIKRYSGTLYGRYFNLPSDFEFGTLAKLCYKRAGFGKYGNWSVARNGMVVEQQLILTSHNLATVLSILDLSHLDFAGMAERCFKWICRRQQTPIKNVHARLRMVKNTAYAWRQMIALLSELEDADQNGVYQNLISIYSEQSEGFRNRFAPAIFGLGQAVSGSRASDGGEDIFLGWTDGQHRYDPSDDA